MLEILLLLSILSGGVTYGVGGMGAAQPPQSASMDENTRDPAPAATAEEFTPEPQTPSGKFTTATEVRPILNATRANWIAVREWDGQDLVYFTHLESWRCGLHAIYYGLNGAPATTRYPMAPCNPDAPAPNALPSDGGHLPFIIQPLKSVDQIDIRILYDDGSEDGETYLRQNVLMP